MNDMGCSFLSWTFTFFKSSTLHYASPKFLVVTLSETQYDWRKIKLVTLKANFIHFWCVESEFMIKNLFHNWTSELGCIWHIFGKFRLFWALFWKSWYSSNCQHHSQQGSAAGCCQCWSAWKEPNFQKMCQMHPNFDVQS